MTKTAVGEDDLLYLVRHHLAHRESLFAEWMVVKGIPGHLTIVDELDSAHDRHEYIAKFLADAQVCHIGDADSAHDKTVLEDDFFLWQTLSVLSRDRADSEYTYPVFHSLHLVRMDAEYSSSRIIQ